ncbi:MAG: hypothetical protein IMF19_12750, partial [Proteobacteria bacterium]|nr:hypothetical protein [Pseudomonadota bacterium]
ETVKDVIRGIGLSLFPAGVVAFLLYRFATTATEISLREMVENVIGKNMEKYLTEISFNVEKGLAGIDRDVKELAPVFVSCSEMGVESVYLNRGAALESFSKYLNDELQKADRGEPSRIWIISSSIKGFMDTAGRNFIGRTMIERIGRSNCDIRVLMTDPNPEIADRRAQQESRGPGEIPHEIQMNLARLKRSGIRHDCIKFYQGTPTVFAIATMDMMLLNPYPYEAEAFTCFSLIVYKTPMETDIYHQYLNYHFEEAWKHANEITPHHWDTC